MLGARSRSRERITPVAAHDGPRVCLQQSATSGASPAMAETHSSSNSAYESHDDAAECPLHAPRIRRPVSADTIGGSRSDPIGTVDPVVWGRSG